MTVIAISMCRNEADVVPYVIPHMLAECDRVLVADNGSTDGTLEMLGGLVKDDPRLMLTVEPRFGYRQAETMNRLVGAAASLGADWVVPLE